MFVNVSDRPVVSLKIGSTLNAGDIKEGDDVYFDCKIRSNPKAYKLLWYHNVSVSATGRQMARVIAPSVPAEAIL